MSRELKLLSLPKGDTAEDRAEKLRTFCKNLVATTPGAGYIGILLDPASEGPILVTSFTGSRDTARALRGLASQLDGRAVEAQLEPKETTDA